MRPAACTSVRKAPARAPGPACYGNGGTQPTVTDAHLLLGHLAADRFLAGRMQLDTAASTRAVEDARCEAARPRRAARRGRHHRDRDRGDGERRARGDDRTRTRSARLRARRLRRRGSAARRRRGARTRDQHRDHSAGAGHVLRVRHAHGRSAARIRADVSRAAHGRRTRRNGSVLQNARSRSDDVAAHRPACRARTRCSNTRSTCATSVRTTR